MQWTTSYIGLWIVLSLLAIGAMLVAVRGVQSESVVSSQFESFRMSCQYASVSHAPIAALEAELS